MRLYRKNKFNLAFFISVIIYNFIYLKIMINYFELNRFQSNKLLIVDSIVSVITLVVFLLRIKGVKLKKENRKKVQVSFFVENINREVDSSNMEIYDKYKRLLDSIDLGYVYYRVIKDEYGNNINVKAIEVNHALLSILGETKENILNYTFKIFLEKYIGEKDDYLDIMKIIQNEGQYKRDDYINISGDKWIVFSIYRVKNEDFALIVTDVSERKKHLDEMKYYANYDALTDLQNRYSIYNHMTQLKNKKKKFAIFFIDLDNFKIINDNLGHDLGDEILHKIAQILKKCENDGVRVGRLGGDEFLVILEEDVSTENIEKLGQAILKSLNSSLCLKSYSFNPRASIGVSVLYKDTENIITLLKYADIAMYYSKKQGGNRISIFSGEMLENEMKKLH